MVNINALPNGSIVERLFDQYYRHAYISRDTSSHWQLYGSKIEVDIDKNGNITSFLGCGFGNIQNHGFREVLANYLCNRSYLKNIREKEDLRLITNIARGNLKKLGLYLSYDFFRQTCSMVGMRKYFDAGINESFDVVIIGDGYGFLASLIKSMYPNARIVLVDIGKVLLFQTVNLQRLFPDREHSLFEGNKDDKRTADFIYVASQDIEMLDIRTFKLAVSISSMQEMNKSTIRRYFEYLRIHTVRTNYFYCCNRIEKTLPDGEVTEFLKYPWVPEDKHYIDEVCPFYRYYFTSRYPFKHHYDGLFIHRLTRLSNIIKEDKGSVDSFMVPIGRIYG